MGYIDLAANAWTCSYVTHHPHTHTHTHTHLLTILSSFMFILRSSLGCPNGKQVLNPSILLAANSAIWWLSFTSASLSSSVTNTERSLGLGTVHHDINKHSHPHCADSHTHTHT